MHTHGHLFFGRGQWLFWIALLAALLLLAFARATAA
jgi:hypothetical protein